MGLVAFGVGVGFALCHLSGGGGGCALLLLAAFPGNGGVGLDVGLGWIVSWVELVGFCGGPGVRGNCDRFGKKMKE